MSASPKLPTGIRVQLGVGTVLTIVGMVWMIVVFFVLKPDQIAPTKDALSDGYDAMRALAGIPFDQWTLRTAGELAGSFVVLLLMNVVFVVIRIGWLTSLCLGGSEAVAMAIEVE